MNGVLPRAPLILFELPLRRKRLRALFTLFRGHWHRYELSREPGRLGVLRTYDLHVIGVTY